MSPTYRGDVNEADFKNEYEEFQKYKSDKLNGRILTPGGLRFIIESNEYDAQKIGRYFLESLPKIREWTKKE